MVYSTHTWSAYSIPPKVLVERRKEFYGLKRKRQEPIDMWLNRVENCIRCCKFSSFMEFLLVDRFICGLNAAELKSIQHASTWTLNQLTEFFSNRNGLQNGHTNTNGAIINENSAHNCTITAMDIIRSVRMFHTSTFLGSNSIK